VIGKGLRASAPQRIGDPLRRANYLAIDTGQHFGFHACALAHYPEGSPAVMQRELGAGRTGRNCAH
jgi:hypothetical protein